MRKQIIRKGDKYNRLTAVSFDHRDKSRQACWLFRCECGNEKVIRVSSVKSGVTKACGCLQKEVASKTFTTHGMSGTKEYSSWRHMKARCLDPRNKAYKNYGERGIIICDRWLNSFENFFADMEKCPANKTLDRIDNNLGYSKENCKWATKREQQNNRRVNHLFTYKGRTKTITQWAKETGINCNTLHYRVKKGWSEEKVFTSPITKY